MTADAYIPSQAVEFEQLMLGALMTRPDSWDKVAGQIAAADLYREDHRRIFSAIEGLAVANEPVDVHTVIGKLIKSGEIEKAGGEQYVYTLANNAGTHPASYARSIRDAATERSLMEVGNSIRDMCQIPGDTFSKVAKAQALVMSITETRTTGGLKALGEILPAVVQNIDARYTLMPGALLGVPTGLSDLDRRLGGLRPGNLIVIAARPGMGKSALCFQIAAHASSTVGPVALFSLEMNSEEIGERLLSAASRIDGTKLRTGRLTENDWPELNAGTLKLKDLPVFCDDTPALTIAQVASRCRSLQRKRGRLGLVVVDYLQLAQGEGDNRTQEVGSISRALKALAKQLECPVIAAAQLSRKVEDRPDKRPNLADLRDSGEIEQDADVVLMLYRDELYNENSAAKGTAEILIRKFRNGSPGMVRTAFIEELTSFENYAGQAIVAESTRRIRGFQDNRNVDFKARAAGEDYRKVSDG